MARNEYSANLDLESAAIERARMLAVLASSGRPVRRVTRKPVGMLARIAALFA